jgi:GNAT superfamily N-acetyltransferase
MTSSPLNISMVEKLAARHDVRNFKCGRHPLDLFIRRDALRNQGSDSTQTYVVHLDNAVMGYYSLAFGSVRLEDSPVSIQASMPAHYPVPVMLFARFAVHTKMQHRGIGRALLKDAFLRTVEASEIGGLAAILVDAIDEKIMTFYEGYGFTRCPVGERSLMVSIKDVRAWLFGVAASD